MAQNIYKRNARFRNYVAKTDSKRIIGVALDTSKTFHRAFIFNFTGKLTVKPFSFDLLQTGYDELKRQIGIAKHKTSAERVYIALETPAKYLHNLVYHLQKDYKRVVFIAPVNVADNRNQRSFRDLKTDDVDCGAIGDLLIRGEFSENNLSVKPIYKRLNNLVSWREQKIILRSMIKNQIGHRFERIYPGMNNNWNGNKKLFTKPHESFLHLGLLKGERTSQEIIRTPNLILKEEMGYGDHPKGNYYIRTLKEKINMMLLPDEESTLVDIDFLSKDVRVLNFLDDAILDVEEEMVRLGKLTPAKYLYDQIAGLGEVSICSYLGLIGDISKIKSSAQIYSYAGLSPKRKQSGGKDCRSFKINRSGNHLLRGLLFRIARQVILCDDDFNEYYHRVRKTKNKSWKESVLIVSRRLNNIMFAIMRDHSEYIRRPL